MKFTGKQLFDIGVPQSKIKFFVGREFESEQDVLAELNAPKETKAAAKNTVLDWIWNTFPHLPMMMNGEKPVKMSKSELKRLMDSGSVEINKAQPKSTAEFSEITFPITSFVWFPKSKRKVSWA